MGFLLIATAGIGEISPEDEREFMPEMWWGGMSKPLLIALGIAALCVFHLIVERWLERE
jgi:hypothetical protein